MLTSTSKTTMIWNHSLVEKLIEIYKDHTCLWNVIAYEYRNCDAKEQALLKMVEDLKVFNDNVTLTAVRNKIHTLRSQFHRERKLQRESIKSGADQVYTPKLWCLNRASTY